MTEKREFPYIGRTKGTPNKVTKQLKEMILGALSDVGGQEYLAEQARENPVAFLALIGKVLPTTLAGADGGAIQIHLIDFVGKLPDPDGSSG